MNTPTPDKSIIERFLSYIMPPSDEACILFECFKSDYNSSVGRIIPFDNWVKTVGGYYNKPDYIRSDIQKLYKTSGYITINPVNLDLIKRIPNVVRHIKAGQGTKDHDILVLRHLFIDIDPVRPKDKVGEPATHEEMTAAIAVRDAIIDKHGTSFDLANTGLWGCSGNGSYILARLDDLPNTDTNVKKIQTILHSLAKQFDTDKVKIDQKTYNPARVCGIPGTIKCKGTSTEERPWRLATIETPMR